MERKSLRKIWENVLAPHKTYFGEKTLAQQQSKICQLLDTIE